MIFKGRTGVLFFIVAGLMVPAQLILLPLFEIYNKVGLDNTLFPMIITYVGEGLPLTVFLMATYFRTVPGELFEACALDGGERSGVSSQSASHWSATASLQSGC